MIPLFDERGNLPPGVHGATWNEIMDRYAINESRRRLLNGLRAALDSLRGAGCKRVFLNGSFVTAKEVPADFDACWDARGVDAERLDPELLDFRHGRAAQKARYGGELFPALMAAAPGGMVFLDYFQRERGTGEPKGIVVLDPESL